MKVNRGGVNPIRRASAVKPFPLCGSSLRPRQHLFLQPAAHPREVRRFAGERPAKLLHEFFVPESVGERDEQFTPVVVGQLRRQDGLKALRHVRPRVANWIGTKPKENEMGRVRKRAEARAGG